MKKIRNIITQTTTLLFAAAAPVLAQGTSSSSVFGNIQAPKGVAEYDAKAGAGQIGLLLFISNIIRLGTIIAGIWVMINFILAGWDYVFSSGDPKAHTNATNKMINSLIGLIIIVSAYTIAGLIGAIFFGDASYIISPKIQGV